MAKKYKYVYEVIRAVQETKSKKEKVEILKTNNFTAVADYLRGTYDNTIQWNLPGGEPPYQPSEEHNAASNFMRKNVDLRHFVKGGTGDRLPAYKREGLFIGLLEAIHPEDAKLVIEMINKKKVAGITKATINEAFPNLIRD